MDSELMKAYGKLVPRDQIIVDAMIIALYKKDLEIRQLAKSITDRLDEQREPPE